MKTLIVIAILAALSAASIGSTARPALAQTVSAVSIDNFTFNPPTLRAKAGATVTRTNKDDIQHGMASDNNAFTPSKALDTNDHFPERRVGTRLRSAGGDHA